MTDPRLRRGRSLGRHMNRRSSQVLALGVSAILLVACGDSGGAGESATQRSGAFPVAEGNDANNPGAELLKAAKAEGEVTYVGNLGPAKVASLTTGFQKAYGIKLNVVPGQVAQVQERLQAEQRTNTVSSDVVGAGTQWLELFKRNGLLSKFEYAGAKNFRFPPDPEGFWYPIYYIPAGIGVNTAAAAKAGLPVPKKWQDLTDPKWKGQLLMDDPTSGSQGFGFTLDAVARPDLGETFIRALAASRPTMVRGVSQPYGMLARGEYAVFYPALESNMDEAAASGAPIDFIIPEEGGYLINYNVGVVEGAPHPNAARLLMHYMLSDEVQKRAFAEDRQYPSRDVPIGEPTPKVLSDKVDYAKRIEQLGKAEQLNQKYWPR